MFFLYAGKPYKRILVRQSDYPVPGFHCRHAAVSAIQPLEKQEHHFTPRKHHRNRIHRSIFRILSVCSRNTQSVPVFLLLLAAGYFCPD